MSENAHRIESYSINLVFEIADVLQIIVVVKVKAKVLPITGHEGPKAQ